jgi:hypothetical protein
MGKTDYKNRDKILEELGYDDYRDYLKSDLWEEIRWKVIKAGRGRCICCGGSRASVATDESMWQTGLDKEGLILQVHHMVYTKENLSGESIYGLVTICRGCHSECEVTPKTKENIRNKNDKIVGIEESGGKKRTLQEANANALKLSKKIRVAGDRDTEQYYHKKPKCKICKIESDNRKEICTYCENQQESMSLKWLGNNDE